MDFKRNLQANSGFSPRKADVKSMVPFTDIDILGLRE